ncbi:tetratricopeptide repeat protein [Shewanella woodyi]|uniref:tetratricopeptide repeat protein n=1 Tax=Shewanella woodyi TaxID=60961 RepID=UPI0037478F0E
MRVNAVCIIWFLGCILLLGCSNRAVTPPKPSYPNTNDQLFRSDTASIPSLDSLIQLTSSQVEDIYRFVEKEEITQLLINEQAHQYVAKKLVNFNYEGKNLSAAEAMATGRGNCMTLALLTYAVAKELNVGVVFQVMHTAPMLQEIRSNLAVTSDHVRTLLYEEDKSRSKGFYLSGRDYAIMDYFPDSYDRGGAFIDESQFIAMYYRNLAADALLDNDLALSFALLKQGASYAPDYAPLLNMMAVVHRRAGDEKTAEEFYLYGMEVAKSKITLLNNYHHLLTSQGKVDSANEIKRTLLFLDDPTPYNWYLLGRSSLKEGDYFSAIIYLEKFLKNSPYYHQAYIELASAQHALGKPRAAEKSLKTALEYTYLSDTQRLYQAKLTWLKQSR